MVKWEGISNPKSNDWVGVYISEDALNTDYLDYMYVDQVTKISFMFCFVLFCFCCDVFVVSSFKYYLYQSPTYQEGYGQFEFSMTNMRTPYQFRYFQYKVLSLY